MNSKKVTAKLLTHKLQLIKLVGKRLQNTNFYAIILISVMFVGIFSLSPATSSLMNKVVITSTGEILTSAYARSGSAEDIQVAVDQIATAGGGNVYIPAGTFSFVEVGEPWMTVEIPAGVNLYGAPTRRDADGQVIEWKTVLVMPYEAPDGSTFFHITGEQDPNKPTRFSDIKLVGYREIDSNSITRYNGIIINDVIDFRVDHCYLRNVAGNGITAMVGAYGGHGRKEVGKPFTCGVIDHCKLVNSHGHVAPAIQDCTVYYGVMVSRGSYSEEWEEDISKVLGHYTNYTVFIEDCYFEKWRHCVASNHGAHYVFRHNTIQYDFSYGSLDAHGWGYILDSRVLVGTRAIEVYENQILDPLGYVGGVKDAIYIRGGGGVIFNNTVTGYTKWAYLTQEAWDEVSKCQVKDVWVWNNNIPQSCQEIYVVNDPNKNQIIEGRDYFRHAPHTFTYELYPYPHPLILEATP